MRSMLGISSLGCFFWTSLCRSMLPWPGVNFLLYDLKQVTVLFWSLTGRSNLQPSVPLWSCPGLHINFLYTWCPWKIQWILFIYLLNYNSSSHPLISNKNTQDVSTKYDHATGVHHSKILSQYIFYKRWSFLLTQCTKLQSAKSCSPSSI